MGVCKIIFLSKWVICRFHVNLPGCTLKLTAKRWQKPLKLDVFFSDDPGKGRIPPFQVRTLFVSQKKTVEEFCIERGDFNPNAYCIISTGILTDKTPK